MTVTNSDRPPTWAARMRGVPSTLLGWKYKIWRSSGKVWLLDEYTVVNGSEKWEQRWTFVYWTDAVAFLVRNRIV